MANLIVQDNGVVRTRSAVHGEEITIQTPCDCSAVTGVQIAGVAYPFYDAAGNVLASGSGLFTEGSLIRVLIDTVNTRSTIINHAITPNGIGAAPAGYGLGSGSPKTISSFDEITGAGWYSKWFEADELPAGAVHGNWTFRIGIYGGPTYYEIIMPANDNWTDYSTFSELRRRRDDTGWYDWEWVNPPMNVGVEYRTTERWQRKAVYTKLVDCGMATEYKQVSFELLDVASIVRYAGAIGYEPLPVGDTNFMYVNYADNQVIINVTASGNFVGRNAYCQLWYTKTS